MTNQLGTASELALRNVTEHWLSTLPAGVAPVAVAVVPGVDAMAVCCDRAGTTAMQNLESGQLTVGGRLSTAVCLAAAVWSHGMAGYVWHETIATLPPLARRAFHVLTTRYEDGMDPVAGAELARRLLGEVE